MRKLLLLLSICFSHLIYSQDFYDRNTIQTVEIFFSFSDWDTQMDNLAATTEDYLVADSVRINGVVFDSVGVKYKGNSSYNASNNKNPMHLSLDHVKGSQDYQGYRDVKLQNCYNDPSMIREVLSYAVLEQYMDCPKANFANVYINGQLRGLYSNAQDVNALFNGDHYYSTNGDFIKCNPIGGAGPGGSGNPDLNYLGSDSSLYIGRYELKSDYGWNDLVDMVNTLNNDFSNIESKLDMDRAIWMLAFNNVLVNLDSYSGAFRQNYYLYRDLNDRFVPTVWDLNMSFGGFPGGTGSGTTDPLTLSPYSNSTSANHPLIMKILADPMYARMYMAHLRTIVQECFASSWYLTEANSMRSVIDASVQADPYKFYTYTQYQNSLTTAVTSGGGPGGSQSIPGIQAMMDSRVTFFNSESHYTLSAPTISAYNVSAANPSYGQTVTVTATCSNESAVYMGYRLDSTRRFNRVQMFDDGAHNDGGAGDHVYGADITLNGVLCQYYIYAENSDAGIFSPQRAEHEFHSIALMPFPSPSLFQVRINEIVATNSHSAYDSNGESDDWIELYNTTSSAFDLSNLYLSDDPNNLQLWQFPAGTAINAYSTLIVWCDDDAEQSGLHTTFKLSSTGEDLILSNGTTGIDEVMFGQQTTDVSYMRCPDGGTTLQYGTPSFNALNNCQLSLKSLNELSLNVFPNPANDAIYLQSKLIGAEYSVIDMQGRTLTSSSIESELQKIELNNYQSGYYLLLVSDAQKGSQLIKFVISK